MAKGQKTGGRKPGSLNRKRRELADLLDEHCDGFDPVVFLARIANGTLTDNDGKPVEVTLDQRITCAKEVACYVRPKRKPVDDTGDSSDKIILQFPASVARL